MATTFVNREEVGSYLQHTYNCVVEAVNCANKLNRFLYGGNGDGDLPNFIHAQGGSDVQSATNRLIESIKNFGKSPSPLPPYKNLFNLLAQLTASTTQLYVCCK